MKSSSTKIPENTWVAAKSNGAIRYVTKHTSEECFLDDGKLSKQEASPHCHFNDYQEIDIGDVIYGNAVTIKS